MNSHNCSSIPYQYMEHLPRKVYHALSSQSPFSHPHSRVTMFLCFFFQWRIFFASSRTSYRRYPTLLHFLCIPMSGFFQNNIFEIHIFAWIVCHPFLLLNGVPLYEYSALHLLSYWWIGEWLCQLGASMSKLI